MIVFGGCAAAPSYICFNGEARLAAMPIGEFVGTYQAAVHVSWGGHNTITVNPDGTVLWDYAYYGDLVDEKGVLDSNVFSVTGRWNRETEGAYRFGIKAPDKEHLDEYDCVCISSAGKRGFVLLKSGGRLKTELTASDGYSGVFFREGKLANQPPLQTSTSGTSAAGEPIAPPSGAAGR